MRDWVDVYSRSILAGVELIKSILDKNGIHFVVMDKYCSSYARIGFATIEIRVPSKYADKAIRLMPHE
ncbi:MAG: hypothetical protein CL823_06490 [Crocinitomicaceae bacterium]|nr:hypothetical protein [Crocinitomicaceae bacterium]|tara:strand:- start:811 stop:1014 length:204 start_codon:yes stop_codon:yes gene_type:complete